MRNSGKSVPIYMAIHNAYAEKDSHFYSLSIIPDWKYILMRVYGAGKKMPRIVVMGVSPDDAPRGIIVYDGCYANVSTPLARDRAVYIELHPIRDNSVPDGNDALFAVGHTGYKYDMFGDDNTYYCCVSPGCGCAACSRYFNTGVVCVGRCDCKDKLFSVDAVYSYDMFMLKMYREALRLKDSCACFSLQDSVYKSHMRMSEYYDNAIECLLNCSSIYKVAKVVPMKPLQRVSWDVMIQKLSEYVEGIQQ